MSDEAEQIRAQLLEMDIEQALRDLQGGPLPSYAALLCEAREYVRLRRKLTTMVPSVDPDA